MAEKISRDPTIKLLNKCWMTHDGLWFFHAFKTLGIEAANQLNQSAIRSMSSIEIQRLKKATGFTGPIDTHDRFREFFQGAAQLIIPDFMQISFSFPGTRLMAWQAGPNGCFAYAGIKRMGAIDRYECGVLHRIKSWLEALGIRHQFNPETGRCQMHHQGYCKGTICF